MEPYDALAVNDSDGLDRFVWSAFPFSSVFNLRVPFIFSKRMTTHHTTQAEGEAAVRSVLPGATIVRPAPVYGQDDYFLNRYFGLEPPFLSFLLCSQMFLFLFFEIRITSLDLSDTTNASTFWVSKRYLDKCNAAVHSIKRAINGFIKCHQMKESNHSINAQIQQHKTHPATGWAR